ncbi:MAG: insulinase family protein [Myxococcales bacterium]
MRHFAGKLGLSVLCVALWCGCGPAPKPPAPPPKGPPPLAADRVILRESPAPVVELRVMFEAGSADDPKGQEGLTYVTVASMLEGGAGGVSYAERTRRLFPMAAEISGHVERQQTVFTARVHKDHLESFYPLFRDVLLHPDFSEADFERVRARTVSSLTQDLRGADDESLGKEVLQSMLFEGHPFGHPEIGTETGLTHLTVLDLPTHQQRILCSKRMRVAVAGSADAGFQARFAQDMGTLITAACSATTALPAPLPQTARRVWIIHKPEAASIAMSLGMPIDVTRKHPDYAALTLAAAYLGQHRTFAGRLMQKMRADRGLNYGDYAYAEHFVQDGFTRFPLPNVGRRQQYFSIWIRPVQPEQAHFALRMAVRELERCVREGIAQSDFDRIQRFVDRYYALFAQTEQQRLGNALDDAFYGNQGPYLDVLRAQVRALTRDQVNAALKRHLDPEKLQIALVAPDAEKFSAQLVAGAPSPIVYASEKPAEILEEDKQVVVYPLNLLAPQVKVVPVAEVFK